jgi:hypothetical protein
MAKLLIGSELGSYTFSKAAKTVTFSGLTPLLENIALIVDATNSTIIYQIGDAAFGGTLSGQVLTLTYNTNTGAFNDTDKLQIFYFTDDPLIGARNETVAGSDTATSGLNGLFKRALQRLTSLLSLFPSSIGKKADADSLSVALSTEAYSALDTVGTATSSIDTRLENGFAIVDTKTTSTTLFNTEINSLANSATVGYISGRIDLDSTVADVLLNSKITCAGSPGSERSVYVFAVPWYHDGTTWYPATGGTTTLPPDSRGSYTISNPHNLRLIQVLPYTTTNNVVQDSTLLSTVFGNTMPDGVSFLYINFTGAALAASGHLSCYKLIRKNILGL